MRRPARWSLFFALLLSLAGARLTSAQSAPDPEQQFKELQKLCREDVQRYAQSGAHGGDKDDPRLKWAARFWEFREKNPTAAVSGDATRESVRMLIEAGRADEALSRIDSLGAEDRGWRSGVLTYLREIATQKSDPGILLKRIEALLAKSTDPALRARLHFSAGRFYQAGRMMKEAEAAFLAAVSESAESDYGKRSARELYDIRNLGVGQVVPSFSVTTLAGKELSPQTLRGRAAVFVFWASW